MRVTSSLNNNEWTFADHFGDQRFDDRKNDFISKNLEGHYRNLFVLKDSDMNFAWRGKFSTLEAHSKFWHGRVL